MYTLYLRNSEISLDHDTISLDHVTAAEMGVTNTPVRDVPFSGCLFQAGNNFQGIYHLGRRIQGINLT